MRILAFIVLSLLATIALNCKNYNDTINRSVYDANKIKGKVYLNDDFLDEPLAIAPKARVYLTNSSNSDIYSLSTTSDSDGVFEFTHQPHADPYLCLVGEFRNTKGILFRSVVRYSDFQKENILYINPQYPEGKIKVTVNDESGQPLYKANAYLFINKEQANSVYNKPDGYSQIKEVSEKGTAAFYNLNPGIYYVTGKKDELVTDPVAITITDSDVKSATVLAGQMKTLTLTPPNQVSVLVNDAAGEAVFNAGVYIFTSSSQAESISTIPLNYIRNALTDKKGKAFMGNLPDGNYVIAASTTLVMGGKDVLQKDIQKFSVNSKVVSKPLSLTLR
nr:carboxypeptidase-like regulatory domain-containing protein [uncultured Arsenicibacter sp.]